MAGRAIASAVEKIGQLLVQEASFLREVRGEVEWLRTELRRMECFLEDADAKLRNGDRRVENWVREVRDIAYQAEDAVDTFMLKIDSRSRTCAVSLRRYACIPSELVDLHGIGNEILQIKSKIDNIKQSREIYGIINLGESRAEPSAADERFQARRQSSCRLDDEAVVVSFDVNKKFLLKRVLDSTITRRCVISIVGMGGLGKTTLAAKVYNSNDVKSHFSYCAWITVSQEYRASELLKNIIKQVMGTLSNENLDKMTLDELKMKLSDFLQRERYIIVMDDIWEEAVWEQIKGVFPNANNGSRLLVTTRFMNVAKCVDPRIMPFELPLLSDDDSWELFLKVVFPSDLGVTPICPKELEELGKELAKRCGGLPLALVVLGGMLSITDPTVNAWREVAENKEWESRIQGKECLQILALSYNHLPHRHLKSCYLYLGCFPEDYKIKSSQVIKLWIAEGFIPTKENRTFEETAKGYLDELAQRCMIQVVSKTRSNRRIKLFRIHDLFRDWCISESKGDGFFRIYSSHNDIAEHDIISSRRLILYGELPADIFNCPAYKARTMLGLNLKPADEMFLKNVVRKFNLLRVIYLQFQSDARFHKNGLPKEISSLVHLRHILIAAYTLRHIPSSIGKLRHLQTFWPCETQYFMSLPRTVCTVETLRHINTWRASFRKLHRVDRSGIGRLRSLQGLTNVKAGNWIQRDLTMLSSLRKLNIWEVRATHVAALSDSLPKLNHLASLYLEADLNRTEPRAASLFAPFPSHQNLYKLHLFYWTAVHSLPRNLVNLELANCIVDQYVIAVVERLPGLAFLKLHWCRFAEEGEMVCTAAGFPQLQHLYFDEVYKLVYWRIESGAMPKLTHLYIGSSAFGPMMMIIPDGLQHVASLQRLELKGPSSKILARLTTGGDLHWFRLIPSLVVNNRPLNQFLQENASTSAPETADAIVGSSSAEGLVDGSASTSYGQGST